MGSEGQSPLGLQGLYPIVHFPSAFSAFVFKILALLLGLSSHVALPPGACLGALKDVAESQASCQVAAADALYRILCLTRF